MDVIASIDSYFMEDADVAIVAYGSVVRPALNAVKLARGVKDERITSKLRFFRDLFRKVSKRLFTPITVTLRWGW